MDVIHAKAIRHPVKELAALLGFAFVGTVSPGPNNTVLWASGLRFGLRRTMPHVLGTALGMGALVVGVAAGIGALVDAVPASGVRAEAGWVRVPALRGGLGPEGRGIGRSEVTRPFTLWKAVAFLWVNPKAWIFAIVAVGAFLPSGVPRPIGVVLLVVMLMVIVVGSSSIWAAGGAALGQAVDVERTPRLVSITLAALLVGSVLLLWV